MRIDVLGTTYQVETHQIAKDKTLKRYDWQWYCDDNSKLIVVADFSDTDYFDYNTEEERFRVRQETLRHEIVHAFLNESGLRSSSLGCSSWATNEEMIDWIARQFSKMLKAFKEVDAI